MYFQAIYHLLIIIVISHYFHDAIDAITISLMLHLSLTLPLYHHRSINTKWVSSQQWINTQCINKWSRGRMVRSMVYCREVTVHLYTLGGTPTHTTDNTVGSSNNNVKFGQHNNNGDQMYYRFIVSSTTQQQHHRMNGQQWTILSMGQWNEWITIIPIREPSPTQWILHYHYFHFTINTFNTSSLASSLIIIGYHFWLMFSLYFISLIIFIICHYHYHYEACMSSLINISLLFHFYAISHWPLKRPFQSCH